MALSLRVFLCWRKKSTGPQGDFDLAFWKSEMLEHSQPTHLINQSCTSYLNPPCILVVKDFEKQGLGKHLLKTKKQQRQSRHKTVNQRVAHSKIISLISMQSNLAQQAQLPGNLAWHERLYLENHFALTNLSTHHLQRKVLEKVVVPNYAK